MEKWLPVVGFEGSYEVSDRGRIRSIDRVVVRSGKGPQPCKGQLLRLRPQRSGHLLVDVRGARSVHALVAEAFIGPRPEGMEIRHLNGDPIDNRVENLVYGTRGQNRKDIKFHAGQKGHLRADQIREIKKRLALGELQRVIAADFSVCKQTISAISTGRHHADVAC